MIPIENIKKIASMLSCEWKTAYDLLLKKELNEHLSYITEFLFENEEEINIILFEIKKKLSNSE